ncbi:MAG: glycosyltransferase family 2 protein [Candidatus Competibacteraceae bacterium]
MNQLSVSMAIPTHNAAKWIDALLTNALEQSHAPAEIIVVDDGSTDNTADIIERRIKEGVGNIRLIRRAHASGGPSVPLNMAFNAAQSPYVAICEQDDLMYPDRLARQLECFSLAEDLGLVTSYASIENFEKSDLVSVYETNMDLVGLQAVEMSPSIHRVKGVNIQEMLASTKIWFMRSLSGCTVRKAAWEKIGGFGETYKVAADVDFILRLCEQFDIGIISEPLYRFRFFSDHPHLYSRERLKAGEEAYHIWSSWVRSASEVLRKSSRARVINICLDLAFEYRNHKNWRKCLAWYLQYYVEGGSLWIAVKGMTKSAMLLYYQTLLKLKRRAN